MRLELYINLTAGSLRYKQLTNRDSENQYRGDRN